MLWLLSIVGCASWTSPQAEPSVAPAALPPVTVDGPIWTSVVTSAPRAVPARFTNGLPPDPQALADAPEQWPPVGHLAWLACHGTDADRDALAAFEALLWECASPELCDWAARGRRWDVLGSCPAVPELASRADLPDDVRLRWAYADPDAQVTRELVRATETALAQGRLWPGNLGLEVIARTRGAVADEALRRLHAAVPPELQVQVALSMWDREAPDLRRLHQRACDESGGWRCGQGGVEPLADLGATVRDWRTDLGHLLRTHEHYRGAVLDALDDCALDVDREDRDLWQGRRCLAALARVDWRRARSASERLADPYEIATDLREALESDGPESLRRRLEALGVPPLGEPDADEVPITALDWLQVGGLAAPVGATETWPPGHERLLLQLARLAGLEDVVFLEVAPDFVEGRETWLTLYAYTGTERLRTLAEVGGLGYDVEHAVGLINAILARRGAEVRLVVAWDVSGDVVVALPPGVAQALVDESLIELRELEVPVEPEAWDVELEDAG